ncbi:MAG TPA: nuclear transport factor 2 family protein [Croceibacterium sp.]|nr:nuclear transport factor 2 family protein [Croceibacterium sp.]
MVRNWVAALAALGGIAVGALVGPHVPGLAAGPATSSTAAALADRVAIEDMVTRYYGNFGKQHAAEDFGAFYTEDAVFDVNGIVSKGRQAIEAFYADSAEEADAPARQGTFHMMISNPVIDVDGDTATAEFMWTGVMNTAIADRPQLWEQGREYDLLVRQNGAWRIKKRTVIADSGLPERYNATYQPRMDYKISAGE